MEEYKVTRDSLANSLAAFNVSHNCDRSSPENFYQSYITRKKIIVEGKLCALKQKDKFVNATKLEWHVKSLEIAVKEKEFCMKTIRMLLSRPAVEVGGKLEQHAKLVLEGLNNEN